MVGLSFILAGLSQVSATVVWSDNFDDGNYDGWTVEAGAFSVTNGALMSEDSVDDYDTIWNSSSTTVGTWNFSLYHESNGASHWIMFMVNGTPGTLESPTLYGYGIEFDSSDSPPKATIRLIKQIGVGSLSRFPLGVYVPDYDFGGTWTDFAVSRNSTGGFNVWINGTHTFESVNTDHDYSEMFVYYTHGLAGGGLDNIVVSDDPLSPPVSTTPTTTPSETPTTPGEPTPIDPMLLAIAGVGVVVVILAVVCLKRR